MLMLTGATFDRKVNYYASNRMRFLIYNGKTVSLQNGLPQIPTEWKRITVEQTKSSIFSEEIVRKTLLCLGQNRWALDEWLPINVKVNHGMLVYARYRWWQDIFYMEMPDIETVSMRLTKELNNDCSRLHVAWIVPGQMEATRLILNRAAAKPTFQEACRWFGKDGRA